MRGKTWKDTREAKALKGVKEPRPPEKGGKRNLIREAQEELEEEKES